MINRGVEIEYTPLLKYFNYEQSNRAIADRRIKADWWYPLGMQELRYVVENGVTHDAWMEYCDFVESVINGGNERPLINFHSWFALNARPKDLK